MTSVQACLRPNQDDTSIQGVEIVTNVETSKVQSFCTNTTLNMTNVATSSVSLDNHVDIPHYTGEKESFCTNSSLGTGQFSDILQYDGADTVSESSIDDNNSNVQVVTNVQSSSTQAVTSATISTNPRVNVSSELPIDDVANARSLLPK